MVDQGRNNLREGCCLCIIGPSSLVIGWPRVTFLNHDGKEIIIEKKHSNLSCASMFTENRSIHPQRPNKTQRERPSHDFLSGVKAARVIKSGHFAADSLLWIDISSSPYQGFEHHSFVVISDLNRWKRPLLGSRLFALSPNRFINKADIRIAYLLW